MGPSAKLSIVKDEMVIATNISLQLSSLSYEVIAIIPKAQ